MNNKLATRNSRVCSLFIRSISFYFISFYLCLSQASTHTWALSLVSYKNCEFDFVQRRNTHTKLISARFDVDFNVINTVINYVNSFLLRYYKRFASYIQVYTYTYVCMYVYVRKDVELVHTLLHALYTFVLCPAFFLQFYFIYSVSLSYFFFLSSFSIFCMSFLIYTNYTGCLFFLCCFIVAQQFPVFAPKNTNLWFVALARVPSIDNA